MRFKFWGVGVNLAILNKRVYKKYVLFWSGWIVTNKGLIITG